MPQPLDQISNARARARNQAALYRDRARRVVGGIRPVEHQATAIPVDSALTIAKATGRSVRY